MTGDLVEALPGSLVHQREGGGTGSHTALLPRVFGLVKIVRETDEGDARGTLAKVIGPRQPMNVMYPLCDWAPSGGDACLVVGTLQLHQGNLSPEDETLLMQQLIRSYHLH